MRRHLETATCYFVNSKTEKKYPSLEEAMGAAESYVGNSRFAKPFKNEEKYLYGPGDGTTSVIVSRDSEIVEEPIVQHYDVTVETVTYFLVVATDLESACRCAKGEEVPNCKIVSTNVVSQNINAERK